MGVDKKIGSKPEKETQGQPSPDRSLEEIESLLAQMPTFESESTLSAGQKEATEDELGKVIRQVRRAHWELRRRGSLDRQWHRQASILVASFATTLYISFRAFFSLNLVNPWAALFSLTLFGAETYGLFHLGLYFYQVWRLIEPPILDVKSDQTVDVFVATYNEDVELLRNTLRACVEMDYPHTTYVLDDGQRNEVRQLAEDLGVEYITRTEHQHAKAGNVNNALRQTEGQFVIILDADHVPHMHMIMRMIGYFNDPQVGFVQAPHTTYNLDNFLGHWNARSRIYWEDVRMFFEAVQLGKNRHGMACFCGSATMFRRQALEDVGLLATETITEDLHTGMRINAAGWKSLAVSEELVVSLAPEDPEAFVCQRLRWGEGNLSVLAYDNPLTMKGLTLPGRINYLASILNWTYGPARLIMYLVPLVMLFTAVAPVANLSIVYISIVAFYLVCVWIAVKIASNRCGNLIGIELAMMASFHIQIHALFRALFRRRFQQFVVTSKRRKKNRSVLRLMWPQVAIVALGFSAISWAATRTVLGLSVDYFGLMVGSLLAMYHATLALIILQKASRQRDPDSQWRNPIQLSVDYQYDGSQGRGVSLSLNEDGLSMLTRQELPRKVSINVTIRSIFTNASCVGEVIKVKELTDGKCSMYFHELAFRNPDATQRQAEKDAIAKLLFGYVVPWYIAEYRGRYTWIDQKGRVNKIKKPFPLPIEVRLPGMAIREQSSVVEQIDSHGLVAILSYPLNVDKDEAQIVIHGPKEDLISTVRVVTVQAIQVGVNTVYRHRLDWFGPPPKALPVTLRWIDRQYRRRNNVFSGFEQSSPFLNRQNTAWATALSILVILTVGTFWGTHRSDLLLLAATKRTLSPAEIRRVETIDQAGIEARHVSADRLLRMYKASVALGNPRQAAELATRLAEQIPENRSRWMITAANHWDQAGDFEKADQQLQSIMAARHDRILPIDERAAFYLEAARVAVAVDDIERSVSLFERSGQLKSFSREQIDEYIGVLLVADKLVQAFRLLTQMATSEEVLRRIVNVYELGKQPQLAVPALEALHAQNPKDSSVMKRLAELAFLRGEPESSAEYYFQLRQLLPNDSEIRKRLAGILVTLKRTDEAISLLREADDVESRILLASVLEMAGDYRSALAELLQVTGESVTTFPYQKQFARLLLANKQYAEAAVYLAECLQLYPDDKKFQRDFINALAASHVDFSDQTDIEDRHRWATPELLAQEPLLRQTLVGIYKQYKSNGFSQLDQVELAQLANVLRRLDMTSDTIEVLHFAVKNYPDSRLVRFRLAQTLADLGRYDDAEEQFTILLKEQR